MKKILYMLMASIGMICYADTNSVHLAWCPSESSPVDYVIYYRTGEITDNWLPAIWNTNVTCSGDLLFPGTNWLRGYTVSTNVGSVTNTIIPGFTVGVTYYFSITSKNKTNGIESVFGEEVRYTIPAPTNRPPNSPQNFRFFEQE